MPEASQDFWILALSMLQPYLFGLEPKATISLSA